jgi:hypothetical protein
MDEALAQQRWLLRVFTTMFVAFAVIALVVAAVGLYAVTAYAVTQHTREIGVRLALGAQPGQVIWFILKRSLGQLTIGLILSPLFIPHLFSALQPPARRPRGKTGVIYYQMKL